MSVYNKFLFSSNHFNFYPLFTTACHNLIQYACSFFILTHIFPSLKSTQQLSWNDYLTKIIPCAFTTGLEIGLSNSSLHNVTLTFYTMVKSGAPVFVLIFAFYFKLEKPSVKLTLVIIIICLGVLLMVVDETEFSLIGYAQVQSATIISGLRWSLTQILLKRDGVGTSIFIQDAITHSRLFTSLRP